MIKNKTILEVKLNDRIYELQCSPESPLGELYDAVSTIRNFVIQKINEETNKESSCCKEPCSEG